MKRLKADFHRNFGLALRTVYPEVASSNLVRLAFGSLPVLGGLFSWGGLGWNLRKAHDLAHDFVITLGHRAGKTRCVLLRDEYLSHSE